MQVVIKIDEARFKDIQRIAEVQLDRRTDTVEQLIAKGTPLTPNVLADALMEERIRGKLDSDTTFEKDIIRDVKCRLSVSIRDHRPCYCGAELREVWRESEVQDADSN